MGMFLIGTCGAIGTDDLLACFVAGNALNWDGEYLAETERRHDEVNSCIDVLLNFGGFMYIGAVMPWDEFNQPELTGITYGRLVGLGFMVILFRRLPAVLAFYKLMPSVCTDYKEALFMGYFGPIGAGAVFYVEHAHHLFPELGDGDGEETDLVRAMRPVVYWLVLFSIVVHGLSIPALDIIYRYLGVQPIQEYTDAKDHSSIRLDTPPNAIADDREASVGFNQYTQPTFDGSSQPFSQEKWPGGGYPDGTSGGYADEVELQKLLARRLARGRSSAGVGTSAV